VKRLLRIDARYLLEEEVIIDELLLGGGVHAFKRVELSSKVTFESVASFDNLVHNFVTLLVGDTWSEREVGQVSANSDTSGLDHGSTLGIEWRAVQAIGVHV